MRRVQSEFGVCRALRVTGIGAVHFEVDTARQQRAQGCQVCRNAAASERQSQRTYFPKACTRTDERVVRLINERLQAKRVVAVEFDPDDFADGLPVKED